MLLAKDLTILVEKLINAIDEKQNIDEILDKSYDAARALDEFLDLISENDN